MDDLDYDDEFDDGAEWYCNHDVPNGCPDCARDRREQEMLEAMTDRERQDYLYGPGGSFETYFAPFGPAWAKEEAERLGIAR